MLIDMSLNRSLSQSSCISDDGGIFMREDDHPKSFASIFEGYFSGLREMLQNHESRVAIQRDEDGEMIGIEYGDNVTSVSTPYQFTDADAARRSKTVTKFGPVEVTTRLEDNDKFSLIWLNRMNNASIGLHKFARGHYIVELSVAGGVNLDVLNFKAIEHALTFAILNTDVKGVQDEHAASARRAFRQFITDREPRAVNAVKFSKSAWQISKLRGTEVQFTDKGVDLKGRLMFLLPTEKVIIVTQEKGQPKPEKHVVPFDAIWI